MGRTFRLFAIEETAVKSLHTDPARVLGRAMLSGGGFYELPDGNHLKHLLFPASDFVQGSWFPDSVEFVDESVPQAGIFLLPRLAVRTLKAALKAVHLEELQRRFEQQRLLQVVLERIDGHSDCAVEFSQAIQQEEEWTLEEADKFEQLAQQVEDLRDFVLRAFTHRQCLVVVELPEN